jgi:Porin subfamily
VGLSYIVDAIYNTGTPVYLTKTWSAVSYYEHVWTPQWRTSIYGGLLGTDFGSGAIGQICGGITYRADGTQLTGPVGFSGGTQAPFSNSNGPGFPTSQNGGPPTQVSNTTFKGNVSNCNPNSSWTQLGTRTMWNPVPDLDIGVDPSWVHLNTAFAGMATIGSLGTVFQSNALGRQGGLYNISNQDSFSAIFRVQRNFLY